MVLIITHLSYGTQCLTNSTTTHQAMDSKTVYLDDCSDFNMGIDSFMNNTKKEDIFYMIEYILNNHTFVNRINTLKTYFGL